jgi:hypothetical protein
VATQLHAFYPLHDPTYNHAVRHVSSSRHRSSIWARLAVLLSFFAVFSALAAPASMLAEEVRTGKLGGICAVTTAAFATADAGGTADSGASHAGSHCELCGSLGLALPPLPLAEIPSVPGRVVLVYEAPDRFSEAVSGLPFSRGPPPFLN